MGDIVIKSTGSCHFYGNGGSILTRLHVGLSISMVFACDANPVVLVAPAMRHILMIEYEYTRKLSPDALF